MNYNNIESYLQAKAYPYKPASGGKELQILCPFCKNQKQHAYIHAQSGWFKCFHCGNGGGWKYVQEAIGDKADIVETKEVILKENEPEPPTIDHEIVEELHKRIFDPTYSAILDYLHNKRGYTDETIRKFKIGWDGRNITYPIFNDKGECVNIKFRSDPTRPIDSKIVYGMEGRNKIRLFNERVLSDRTKEFIIICEGEPDCLLLDQMGYPAVTSTGGCSTFKSEWVEAFLKFKKVYLCYDNDRNGAGQNGVNKTAQLFYEKGITTHIVILPEPTVLEEKLDVTDFFIKKEKTREDFTRLLDEAKPYIPSTQTDKAREKQKTEGDNSLALKLVESVRDEGIYFFHDQYKEGYAALSGDGRQILKLRSRLFRQWLAHHAWRKLGKIPSSDILSNLIQVLEGGAIFSSAQHELFVRVANEKGSETIWYDMGNGSAVRIGKEGWTIIDTPPILLKRYPHQVSQVYPEKGGSVSEICNFVNLHTEEDKLLFQIFMVASFIPEFPHPILVLYGPQGAGKTTPLRLLKSIIDPSILQTLTAPDGLREFIQLASHHWFIFLDNLSYLPDWLSDALARACTGDGFSKRELFSDDDDVIYTLQRPVGLNGINLITQKPDLLERSIILALDRIPKNKRRQEKELWEEFDRVKPRLLGAVFDAVTGAIGEYSTIRLKSYPRMADFTQWGCAIAKTLGYKQEEFIRAYFNNISRQNDAAIEASPIGTTILAFMEDKEDWKGTPSELLGELETQAIKIKVNTKSRDWPRDAAWLTRRIQQIQTNLAEEAIKFTRDDKSRPRKVLLQKFKENADGNDIPSAEGQNEAENIPTVPVSPSSVPDEYTDAEFGAQELPSVSTDASDTISASSYPQTSDMLTENSNLTEV